MNGIKNFKNMYSILTICLILVGAVLLIAPGVALDVVCIIFGIYMIIYGAVRLLDILQKMLTSCIPIRSGTWYSYCNCGNCICVQDSKSGAVVINLYRNCNASRCDI